MKRLYFVFSGLTSQTFANLKIFQNCVRLTARQRTSLITHALKKMNSNLKILGMKREKRNYQQVFLLLFLTNSFFSLFDMYRLSFPSGHASFSAYTMLFVVFYLQSRMTWSGSKFLRPTIQIAVLLLAWFTGLSRVADHKHHW